jgi:hypothetical protein
MDATVVPVGRVVGAGVPVDVGATTMEDVVVGAGAKGVVGAPSRSAQAATARRRARTAAAR